MTEMKKLEISFDDVACSQEVWNQLQHLEWFYRFGLRETADITYPSVQWGYEDG